MSTLGDLARQDEYAFDPLTGAPIGGSGESAGAPSPAQWFGQILAPRPRDPNSPVQYRTASPLVNITEQDIQDAMHKTLDWSGGGLGIKAYHSSPHDFNKFDLSRIGTGEGAQVYGHGLYFAENPAVSGQGGQYWNQFAPRFSGPEQEASIYLKAAGFDRGKATQMMRDHIDQFNAEHADYAKGLSGSDADAYRALQDRKLKTLGMLESDKPVGPRTYEVDINADPAHMLDWDKPLREQQQLIDPLQKAGVSKSLLNEASGGDLYGKAAIDFHRPGLGHLDRALASEKFAEVGIPGIKYLDEGSRLAGNWHLTPPDQTVAGKWMVKNRDYNSKGLHFDTEEAARAALAEKLAQRTSNYVVFNPGIIDIMKKYGLAGATAGTMGALAAQDDYQQ